MTETVKPIRGEDTDFGVVYVIATEYARLEQEYAELAERYGKLQTGEGHITHRVIAERDAALKQVEGLREALINARNILDRNLPTLDRNIGFCPNIVEATVKEIERIDAALSAKP